MIAKFRTFMFLAALQLALPLGHPALAYAQAPAPAPAAQAPAATPAVRRISSCRI